MLLGIKTKKEFIARHVVTGSAAILLVYLIWTTRPEINFDARLWRSLGDSAFIFLSLALIIGPLSRLFNFALRFVSWRRELGIWFAILALSHFIRVFNYAFKEPGLELSNLLGFMALFWSLVLAATSSDKAVSFLSISSWKWLHRFAYVVFYAAAAHVAYFLFWRAPVENWFIYIFLFLVVLVPALQIAAFIKTVVMEKRRVYTGGKMVFEKKIKAPILDQKIIAPNTCQVSFDISKIPFIFKAGQYIQIRLPKLNYNDPKGLSRVFSIATSPNDKIKLSVAFKNFGSGFKKTLMELPKGALIDIEGPYGSFCLPINQSQQIVFIAGGIGITPCISMIRFANENKLQNIITLLYANNNQENAAYFNELNAIAKENNNFKVINKFGKIDADFITGNIKNLTDCLWYIVGPPAMVEAVKNIVSNLGIKNENIIIEDFIGY